MKVFVDRLGAGKNLAEKLVRFKKDRPIILALPRGGVPVGFEISKQLLVPLKVLIVRKLGAPSNPEFGIGAICESDEIVLDTLAIESLNISQEELLKLVKKERAELKRRVQAYRGGKKLPTLKGKTVVIVDDGLATGLSAKVAISYVKRDRPKKLILAVPVCSEETFLELQGEVDEFICLLTPKHFGAIGNYYQNFPQLTDKEINGWLKQISSS